MIKFMFNRLGSILFILMKFLTIKVSDGKKNNRNKFNMKNIEINTKRY